MATDALDLGLGIHTDIGDVELESLLNDDMGAAFWAESGYACQPDGLPPPAFVPNQPVFDPSGGLLLAMDPSAQVRSSILIFLPSCGTL